MHPKIRDRNGTRERLQLQRGHREWGGGLRRPMMTSARSTPLSATVRRWTCSSGQAGAWFPSAAPPPPFRLTIPSQATQATVFKPERGGGAREGWAPHPLCPPGSPRPLCCPPSLDGSPALEKEGERVCWEDAHLSGVWPVEKRLWCLNLCAGGSAFACRSRRRGCLDMHRAHAGLSKHVDLTACHGQGSSTYRTSASRALDGARRSGGGE